MRRKVIALLLLSVVATVATGCRETVTGTPQTGARSTTQTTAPSASTAEGPVALGELAGTWTGTYTCNQGETELTLSIEAPVSGSARTVFAFGPTTRNPGVPKGSYEMTARYVDRTLGFIQQRWLEQPSGYLMVNLAATAVSTSSISGTVQSTGCTTFKVTRDRH